MATSVFDIFRVGIGPSSSHTVGPMRAALSFVSGLKEGGVLTKVRRVRAELYGSLGATGKVHRSDKAVLLGLAGHTPELVDPIRIDARIARIRDSKRLSLLGIHPVDYCEHTDLVFLCGERLSYHPNGMRLVAFGERDAELANRVYYSVGGGFVVNEEAAGADRVGEDGNQVPYPFHSGDQLLTQCAVNELSVSQLMLENEKAWRSEAETRSGLLHIWQVMQSCVRRGCEEEGILPGGMKIRRRAAGMYRKLCSAPEASLRDPLTTMDWVNLYALAVNEENAAGGRIVTAPTNGAAGIIPAVLHYYYRFIPGATEDGVVRFLLTAAAIGILFKENASISGAEMGCQGEVGVACSMAAGALAEVMGGTPEQVENAAEIGMEHNLGLTCDPVGGLVQVPCIERNAMGSMKAINAARMALRGDGKHFVSLDKVIKTTRDTGRDMKDKYKGTSRGGLTVNFVEC